MKAVICREFGPAQDLELADLPEPAPGPGEVLVGVEVAGVNFPDALMVNGTYQVRPERPFIPGSEVAGRVVAVGEGVTDLTTGQPVTAFCGVGGYAELVTVARERVTVLDEGTPMGQAAVLPVAYGTAQHALTHRARLKAGESVLVLGAAGGVGIAALQLARAQSAKVTAVVSSEVKADLVRRSGADEVVVITPIPDGVEAPKDALLGLGSEARFDVVVDAVGGTRATSALRRLTWGGRYLVIGFASGDIPQFRINRVLLHEGEVLGVLWGQWARRNPGSNAAMMADLASLLREGRIAPHLHRSFPLAEAPDALAAVSGRHVLGKVVLRTGVQQWNEGTR